MNEWQGIIIRLPESARHRTTIRNDVPEFQIQLATRESFDEAYECFIDLLKANGITLAENERAILYKV